MSGIVQLQRRAIEALAGSLTPITIHPGQRFFIGRKGIFFRDISEGVGTCSDLHGKRFAVFSKISHGKPALPKKSTVCDGAVFIKQTRKKAALIAGQMKLQVI